MRSSEVVFEDLLRQVDLLLEDGAGPGEQADVVRDLLAFLAEEMTDLHQQRQEEKGSFLTWLEERIGCPIDELSGKTYVFAYDEQPERVGKLLEVLAKNHPSKTPLDVAVPESYGAVNRSRERIIEGFEKSKARLEPIRRRIQLTDALIDRIVYRLYGLTEDEIALVESL